MWSIAAGGISATLTNTLPLTAEIALGATRRPSTSTSVSRLRNWIEAPPPVRWLLLVALVLPALLRPAKAGICLRRMSSKLVLTPPFWIWSAPTMLTGTAS
jgi:hypothetical protein